MDWEKWDWFFGPDSARRPSPDGTEPPEEDFTFGVWTEEDPGREAGDEDSIW